MGPFTFTQGRDPASNAGVVVLSMKNGRFEILGYSKIHTVLREGRRLRRLPFAGRFSQGNWRSHSCCPNN